MIFGSWVFPVGASDFNQCAQLPLQLLRVSQVELDQPPQALDGFQADVAADKPQLAALLMGELHIHLDLDLIGQVNFDGKILLCITQPWFRTLDQQPLE